MRRRLKTSKKEKESVEKTKTKKAVTSKKKLTVEPEIVKKPGVQVRVISRPQRGVELRRENNDLEVDGENELERQLEEIKKQKIESIKPKKLIINEKIKTLEEVDKQKQILMWSGIVFFMVLITFFWVNNTKKVVKESREKIIQQATVSSQWDGLVDELSDKIVEMKSGLESIETFGDGATTSTETIQILPNTNTGIKALSEEEFNEINQKIEPEVKDKIRFIY